MISQLLKQIWTKRTLSHENLSLSKKEKANKV